MAKQIVESASCAEASATVQPSPAGADASRGIFQPAATRPFGARQFGAVNWLGLWTLYMREVRRFMKVSFQTVLAPVVSSLLFLLVFMFAIGQTRGDVQGAPFVLFLAPGLVMMSILNNAFANSSSSLLISKVQGSVVDFLMPPLSASELTVGFLCGAATRGVLVGVVTGLAMSAVMMATAPMAISNVWAILYFGVSASVLLGAVGVLGGVWAEKFDQLAAVTNFVITPMAFLSGSFYSIAELHEAGRMPDWLFTATQLNPFFYMIDGFRYGFTGVADAPVLRGALVIAVLNVVMIFATYRMFKSGYRLKG